MSARKLGRLAGLVFVLAAAIGGVSAATQSTDHTGGDKAIATTSEVTYRTLELVWE
jgi:hypothetical protein